jgi:hypothetical protein
MPGVPPAPADPAAAADEVSKGGANDEQEAAPQMLNDPASHRQCCAQ